MAVTFAGFEVDDPVVQNVLTLFGYQEAVVADFVVKMDGEFEVPLKAVTVGGLHKWPRGWDEFVWLSSMLR